jgi:hypothetical protein
MIETKFDGYRLMARIEAQGAADHPQRPRLDEEDAGARRGGRGARRDGTGSTARSSS